MSNETDIKVGRVARIARDAGVDGVLLTTQRNFAWVTGGESLHNNHHAYPRSPRFSVRRLEFDPSWLVIRAIAAVGLLVVIGTLPGTPTD